MSELRPRREARHGARPAAGAIARHGRLRRIGPARTLFKLLAAAVGVLLVSATCVAAYAVWDVASSGKKAVHLVDAKGNPIPQVGAIDGAFNMLLVGTDTRTGQGDGYGSTADSSGLGLNDVTMLLHVSKDHKAATVVSFPRDMIVPIPSCPDGKGGSYSAMSGQKMNTTLTYGGLSCSVLTVQQLTGMTIPYAAMIEFNGVVEMSNAVGGVPVCVAGAIDDPYTSLHLTAGEHTLKGMQALEFLRTRHGVGDGSDLGRISNQQVFLSSLVRTIKSADTLANPAKVFGLAKAAVSNMTLSDSLDATTLASMAFALKNINLSDVLFIQYPNHYIDGGGEVLPTTDAAQQLFSALSTDTPLKLTGDTGVGSEANPNAPAATTPPSSTSTAVPTTPASGVELPSDVHGQTANQYTCSKAYSG
jgi:LCP family protein required for cell wall assembly